MSTRPAGTSRHMARAFELARAVRGTTSPNPAVGAVILSGSRIVGEGATQPPGRSDPNSHFGRPGRSSLADAESALGGPHAEVMALREAGELARGATMYVTLEPCAHFGRTPPCSEAIIQAGIASVVVAVTDPDPRVSGRGLEQLRDAGIEVNLGDGAAQGALHYEAYAHHRRTGRPFVTAKFAASLDGKIASTSGDSRWVSGPQTLRWAHQNRPLFDAMLVGVETIIVDDPQLSARPDDWRGPIPQPLRVVLDGRGRTPLDRRVLEDTSSSPTLIATTEAAPPEWRDAIQARGVDLVQTPSDPSRKGRVSLPDLLDHLGRERGVVNLLVEGGGVVLGSFFDQRLINKVTAVLAPMIIGGDAQTAVRGRGAERMRDVVRLNNMTVERLGADLLVSGYPSRPELELQVRIRTAGPADVEDVDLLLAAQGVTQVPACQELLARAMTGEAVVWLAVTSSPRATSSGDDEVTEEILGVGAIELPTSDARANRAAMVCLAARLDAPASAATRLREACEASAAGRDAEWLTCSLNSAPGLSEDEYKSAGYRYYHNDAENGIVLIRRL